MSESRLTGAAPSGAKPPSIWSRTFITLCIVNLFQVVGQMMMTTIIPLYAREMGASASAIGIVVGAFAISALITRPVFSPAFDSFRKVPILFSAILVLMACSFLYGLVSSVQGLFFVRLLHGLAMGCTGPLALALVSETLPQEKIGSGISTFSLAQALAQAVGPALGLWLIDVIGFSWTFRLSGISMIVAACMVLTVKEKPKENRPKYKISLSRCFALGAVPPAVLTGIFSAANSSIMSFIAIYGGVLGVQSIGLYFTVHAICLLATRPLFGKLADKLGFAKVMVPSLIAYASAFVLISQSTQLWMFLIAAVITACGYGVCSPLFQAMAMASVPRSRSGAASSTNFTGLDSAQLVGPTVMGFVAEHFHGVTGSEAEGYSCMYLVVTGLCAAGLVLYLMLYRRMQRNMREAAEQNERELAEQAEQAAQAD